MGDWNSQPSMQSEIQPAPSMKSDANEIKNRPLS